ncbi:hypothetical protein Tco_1005033 [Tanacetum coccineum]|uniref:Uncharacterized protein n=1 Tax=Tanacetum coccineum TaxID=301880 RepID=A0ABQ5DG14_9ASTR
MLVSDADEDDDVDEGHSADQARVVKKKEEVTISEDERPATPEPEWTIPPNDFPKQRPSGAMPSQTRTGKEKLCKANLEGPAFNLVKAFQKNNVFLQFQMDECHKLLTNKENCSSKLRSYQTSINLNVLIGMQLNIPKRKIRRLSPKQEPFIYRDEMTRESLLRLNEIHKFSDRDGADKKDGANTFITVIEKRHTDQEDSFESESFDGKVRYNSHDPAKTKGLPQGEQSTVSIEVHLDHLKMVMEYGVTSNGIVKSITQMLRTHYIVMKLRRSHIGFSGTGSLPSGCVDLTGDEDPTDEDGDIGMGDSIGVSASLGGEIFRGKNIGNSNLGDSDNTRDGGKIVGGA